MSNCFFKGVGAGFGWPFIDRYASLCMGLCSGRTGKSFRRLLQDAPVCDSAGGRPTRRLVRCAQDGPDPEWLPSDCGEGTGCDVAWRLWPFSTPDPSDPTGAPLKTPQRATS